MIDSMMTAMGFRRVGVEVVLPIKTVAGLNAREHHMARARRVKRERGLAATMVPARPLPAVVTLTRMSAGTLDDDNLQGACKGIRDGIADKLGVADNDPRIEWRYAQEKTKRGVYGVRVRIEDAE